MTAIANQIGNPTAARAVGRCYGALFFTVFGGAWLLLAFYAFERFSLNVALPVALVVLLFIFGALKLQKRGADAAKNAYPPDEEKRNDRAFMIVNAITWITVFLLFQILPRLGYNDLSFPVLLAIVGLHFFFMPPLYRHRANFVLGAILIAWAIVCPFIFKGNFMIGMVSLGGGLALWIGAGWALHTANHLLKEAGL